MVFTADQLSNALWVYRQRERLMQMAGADPRSVPLPTLELRTSAASRFTHAAFAIICIEKRPT